MDPGRAGRAPALTFVPMGVMGAELLDQLEDLALHLDLVLVADAILTQEVEADCFRLQQLHIFQLQIRQCCCSCALLARLNRVCRDVAGICEQRLMLGRQENCMAEESGNTSAAS